MTLAEKIVALRGERKLSQGDLAERLDVSRQSVSKWETGQSVPELDKIVKLADLFGVTVDELVRDAQEPSPEAVPAEKPERKVVYIGWRYTPVQTLGIIMIVGGLVMMLFAFIAAGFFAIGGFLVAAGLPLLLAKKHPFLIAGWIVWALAYALLCTPYVTGASWQPFTPVVRWWRSLASDPGYISIAFTIWLMWAAYVVESALTIALPIFTLRLWLQKRRAKQQAPQQTDTISQ